MLNIIDNFSSLFFFMTRLFIIFLPLRRSVAPPGLYYFLPYPGFACPSRAALSLGWHIIALRAILKWAIKLVGKDQGHEGKKPILLIMPRSDPAHHC